MLTREQEQDLQVGCLYTTIPVIALPLYMSIVIILHRDPTMWSNAIFRLWFWLGVCDLVQLVLHAGTGVLLLLDITPYHPTFIKFYGATANCPWMSGISLQLAIASHRGVYTIFMQQTRNYTAFVVLFYRVCEILCLLVFPISWLMSVIPTNFVFYDYGWHFEQSTEAGIQMPRTEYILSTVIIGPAFLLNVLSVIVLLSKKRELEKKIFKREFTYCLHALILSADSLGVTNSAYFFDSIFGVSKWTNVGRHMHWVLTNALSQLLFVLLHRRLRRRLLEFIQRREFASATSSMNRNNETTVMAGDQN